MRNQSLPSNHLLSSSKQSVRGMLCKKIQSEQRHNLFQLRRSLRLQEYVGGSVPCTIEQAIAEMATMRKEIDNMANTIKYLSDIIIFLTEPAIDDVSKPPDEYFYIN